MEGWIDEYPSRGRGTADPKSRPAKTDQPKPTKSKLTSQKDQERLEKAGKGHRENGRKTAARETPMEPSETARRKSPAKTDRQKPTGTDGKKTTSPLPYPLASDYIPTIIPKVGMMVPPTSLG